MKLKTLLVLLVLIVLSSCRSVVAPEFDLNPIVKKVKSENIEYKKLVESSDLVVKVKVLDKLDLSNSQVKNKTNFHSIRHVEVLDVLENNEELDVKVKDVLVVKEAAAIDTENVYYTNNHMPLVESTEYVLYLNENGNEEYELIDGDNGVVNLSNVINNQNIEVTVNTLFKHFKPMINDKEIPYTYLKLVDQPKNVKFDRVTVKTEQVELPLRVGKDTSTNVEYIVIGTFYFQLEKPLLHSLSK